MYSTGMRRSFTRKAPACLCAARTEFVSFRSGVDGSRNGLKKGGDWRGEGGEGGEGGEEDCFFASSSFSSSSSSSRFVLPHLTSRSRFVLAA